MKRRIDTKRLAYVLLCLSFILIISGSFSSFLLGLKTDHEKVLSRMEIVSSEFERFSTNTTVFEEKRDDLYNNVLGNVYYDTMFQTDKEVKEKISNYENLVDELTKSTKYLDSLCKGVYYPKSEVNSMCVNYKSIYEQVVNYFVSDIKTYNENVDKFNEYQKNTNNKNIVKKYATTKKYVDYNNDKAFDGKED